MTHVTDIEVCADCLIAIANGDFSGMDDAQQAATIAGMERETEGGKYHLLPYSEDDATGFSYSGCQCCRHGGGCDRLKVGVFE